MAGENNPGGPLVVLVVEDHESTGSVLGRMIRKRGFEVREAGSVAEAMDCAEREKIHFLIADIGLVDGSGWDLMATLKVRYGLNGVAITGYDGETARARSLKAGFLLHVVKPIDVEALNSILELATETARR